MIIFILIVGELDCLQVSTESVASVSPIYFNCKKEYEVQQRDDKGVCRLG